MAANTSNTAEDPVDDVIVQKEEEAKGGGEIDDPELEAILNDAMKSFGKIPTIPAKSKKPPPHPSGSESMMDQAWTEEFIKEATAQFEKKMRECLQTQQEMGAASSNVQTVKDDLEKVVEAATKAAVGNVAEPSAVMGQLSEAMKHLNMQAAGGSGGGSRSNQDQDADPFSEEEFAKLMNGFGMGGMGGGGGGAGNDAEFDDLLPFMTNFMQKLLSKDLLYPVLSDIVDRYPEWLADNRQKLSSDEFEKYNKQYEYMKLICEEYGAESPSDSEDTKRKRFDKISELMVKVQCCGSPPKDLIGEDSTFPSMDPAAMMAGFGGFPTVGGTNEQCSIV